MALHRENILSLIGSRRYHSAILTTFSFDFFFFEMKAMKLLRSCGVRNVNVLIDGHYYSELMKQMSGEEMKLTPGYSLYPVYGKSIFHSKIWMLFGEKEGLLIIGSGNLTNAGNGNNEEIWGAFHFDIRYPENATLFSTAWNYLLQLCSNTKGLTREKTTHWIEEHTKWLNELPKPAQSKFIKTTGKDKVAFLYNGNQNTIWKQLNSLIGNQKVIELTTFSPYYDNKGKSIQALSKLFPKAKVNIVIDETGSVPIEVPVVKNYSFYNWNDLSVSKSITSNYEVNAGNNKLHAKIIHFRTSSGKEYCLFGSANVTPQGLGLPGVEPNDEVSLLIESSEGGLLNRFGLKLKKPSTLSEFKALKEKSIYDCVIGQNKSNVRLLSAELVYDELYIYADGNYKREIMVKLFDRENRDLQLLQLGKFAHEMKVSPTISLIGVHYVELFDKLTEKSISNKSLLSDYYLLAKTHPNPKTEDIENIYNEIQGGEHNKVLDLLHYAIFDETERDESTNVMASKGLKTVKNSVNKGPIKLKDFSSYKEIEHNSIEKGLLFSSMSLRVLDVLKFMRSIDSIASTRSELMVDEQDFDLDNKSGLEETEIYKEKNINLAILKSEKRKLTSYLEKLHIHQKKLLYSNEEHKDYKPTLTDLTKYLIALELLFEYGGRTEKYVEKEKEHHFIYLPTYGKEPYFNDNVKGCCFNIVGNFLMLARNGFKEYEFEYTRNKLSQLQHEALISTIVYVLNIRWNEIEVNYAKCLLLNCLHYLGYRNSSTHTIQYSLLKKSISEKSELLKHKGLQYQENLNWFENEIIPAFKGTVSKLKIKEFDTTTTKGSILYKSPWGYCWVKDISRKNEYTLVRPGFMWDINLACYVRYNNDDIYKPIPLSQFIVVEF